MLKALLVDDEPNNLTSLEFLLHHDCDGVTVKGKAGSAAEARAWLSVNTADVVFLDITMPGESGFDLWPAFRALNGIPSLIVHGEISDLLSAATVAKMVAENPAMKSVTIPNVGHAPTLDEPEAHLEEAHA